MKKHRLEMPCGTACGAVLLGAVLVVLFPVAAAGTEAAGETLAASHVVFESPKGPLLLGEVSAEDILARFPEWQQEYEAYAPDAAEVARLAAIGVPVQILCVLGTWCSDSEREMPRFWKLLDEAANPDLQLRMLAVGRRADAEQAGPILKELGLPADIRAEYAVELVPTFIFSSGGVELGRIEETPEQSLEADATAILVDLIPVTDTGTSQWR